MKLKSKRRRRFMYSRDFLARKNHHSYCFITGKLGYNSWVKAHEERQRMDKEGLVDEGYHLSIYKCDSCGLFHLGSSVNGSENKQKKKLTSNKIRKKA
jgi:hypothetical protein